MSGWSRRLSWGVAGGVDLATEEGRSFLQERLALFGRIAFLIDSGLFLSGHAALVTTVPRLLTQGASSAGRLYVALNVAAMLMFLAMWLVNRRGRRPLWLLQALDVASVFVFGSIAVIPIALGYAEPVGMRWAALLMLTNALAARAVIVPSSPRRTLRIGLLCSAPVLLVTRGLTMEAPLVEGAPASMPFLLPAALWCLCGVAVSTVASGVIFGLRRRVDAARRLGQYTLEAKLGEGGMGVVYRARHAMLRRPTAVKLLPPERAGAQNLLRFEREVQTTAQLSHPNTVAIFDYGRTPDGVFYYAMEFLEGIDLDALVHCFGAQPPGRVIHVLRQVAGALGEAHAAGLIHRDVKPGNIILCSRGGAPDVAKVVDFGLVRELAPAGTLSESAIDFVTGTPLYLSPEAITAPARVDGRSDLYALGAVGYLLLSGRAVFDGRTVVEVCAQHLHTAPAPPSARLGAALPEDLEAVVLACLEKRPELRPQSAAELVERLEACGSASSWSDSDARDWWRRNGTRVAEIHACRAAGCPAGTAASLAISLDGRLAGVQ